MPPRAQDRWRPADPGTDEERVPWSLGWKRSPEDTSAGTSCPQSCDNTLLGREGPLPQCDSLKPKQRAPRTWDRGGPKGSSQGLREHSAAEAGHLEKALVPLVPLLVPSDPGQVAARDNHEACVPLCSLPPAPTEQAGSPPVCLDLWKEKRPPPDHTNGRCRQGKAVVCVL